MTTLTSTLTPARQQSTLKGVAEVSGRALLSGLFLISGVGKISAYAGTAAYMDAVGVPAAVLPLVIAAEIGGALALIAGFRTRLVASLLAAFSVITAVLFHGNFADQVQQIMFLKNLSIAGGFLVLATNGPGRFSLDARGAG